MYGAMGFVVHTALVHPVLILGSISESGPEEVGCDSWGEVALKVFLFSQLYSICANVAFHRFFAHNSFETSRPMRFLLAIMGTFSLQRGPLWWAATHRHHHVHCDTDKDVHSPKQSGFFYAHVGWLLVRETYDLKLENLQQYEEMTELWVVEAFAGVIGLLFLVSVPPLVGIDANLALLSLATSNHGMWCINSVCHYDRSGEEGCVAADVWWLGILNGGEGFHAAHHETPGGAKHGRKRWFNIDVSYMFILLLEALGLIWNVQHPGEPDTRLPHQHAPEEGEGQGEVGVSVRLVSPDPEAAAVSQAKKAAVVDDALSWFRSTGVMAW